MNLSEAANSSERLQRLSRGGVLGAGLLTLWGLMAALTLAPGMLQLTFHDGDAIHLAALVLRIAGGELPHLDFMTPIGIGALWPVAVFVKLGAGLGTAFVLAQAALAALLLPALWWVGMHRFGGGGSAFCFGAVSLVLAMALVHGGLEPHISVSMHYNRWAWAVSYVLLALILLPPGRPAPRVEGTILGAGFTFLALTKITFFVGLAPVALIALALRREGQKTAWAFTTGLVLAGLVTIAVGPSFWAAYLRDLLTVATSDVRAHPGVTLSEFLGGLTHLGATIMLLAAVVVVSQAGRTHERVILLAAAPGLMLVTWQNFGNDPLWLPLLALVMSALVPPGRDGRPFIIAAVVAGALALPTAINLATSPLRLTVFSGESAPLLSGVAGHEDFRVAQVRREPGYRAIPSPLAAESDVPAFWGGVLPLCKQLGPGMLGYVALAQEAARAGFAGRPALVADTLQPLWLFADFPPLEDGGPWYYGDLPGAETAEIIIVPLCPLSMEQRQRVLDDLAASGRPVSEAFRGRLAVVLELGA
jgi:hypothetical protein